MLTAAVTSMVGNAGPGQAPAVSVQESEAPLVRGSGCQCVRALLGVPRLCPLAPVLRACGTSNTLQVFGGGEEGAHSGSSCCCASPTGVPAPLGCAHSSVPGSSQLIHEKAEASPMAARGVCRSEPEEWAFGTATSSHGSPPTRWYRTMLGG